MKFLIQMIAILALAAGVNAAELNQFVPGKSQIAFVSKQMGVSVDGHFGKFDVQLAFDPAKAEAGKLHVDIDLGSIDAGSLDANNEVKGKDWLDIAAFPKASFTATSVKALGGGRYEARGPLSIKGVKRDMVIPFTVRNEGTGAWLEGGFILSRLQFKIGGGVWGDTDTVADNIQVKFKLFVIPKK